MELNTETEIDGVLFAQQRPQESQQMTPVAKKTRSCARLKSSDDDLVAALPKTPNAAASTSTRLLSETPRRSTRKSIRPPMDYDDIIENNLLRSASKANKEVAAADAVEEEEVSTHKWNAAEVGRHSRKRSRKTKRAASKRVKHEEEEKANAGGEQKEERAMDGQEQKKKYTMKAEELEEKCAMEVEQQEDRCTKASKEQEKPEIKETEPQESVEEQEKKSLEKKLRNKNTQKQVKEAETEPQGNVKEQETELQEDTAKEPETKSQEDNNELVIDPQEVKKQVIELKESESQKKDSQQENPEQNESQEAEEIVTESNVAIVAEIVIESSSPEVANKSMETIVASAGVAINDLDELGLCPLNTEETDKVEDEHNENMPSLIMLDDEDPDEPTENQMDIAMPRLQLSPEKPTKIVVTDENDVDRTLLRMENSPKSKGFRFATPAKINTKMNFKFTAGNISDILDLDESCRSRRRSKSVCGVGGDKTKTVSFFSPIEVTAVDDIDKRWEKFNISHVTQRRKRSISLDDPFTKSRIPKPKFFPVVKAPTPVKLKARTKLPNFAAIHQKQFNKMENLVDHLERKAVRAKELTNSAIKLANGNASAQKSSAKKLPTVSNLNAVDRPRPRALKKIELPSYALTPLKPEEIERQKNLPTPRLIIGQQQKSRLPLLAKSVTKIFTSIATAPAPSSSINKPGTAVSAAPAQTQSKLEARRQRHMEMFKGRTTKENKTNVIRGVRSNRRFELQMKHRQQLNGNK
ncbi:probable inactive protein kinase DDB_G0270444 isoform X2 [Drosophila innubila]|uniref:probable inactive protein kinase DDB_G0270444 isoform X2 n=1 Tax=Drosophila innubila TaxID=198719 RepID=UPI00148CF161|nr:probable inactive protein kinase DDB_G0270444 isoform X2 [Drosophila innubila]